MKNVKIIIAKVGIAIFIIPIVIYILCTPNNRKPIELSEWAGYE